MIVVVAKLFSSFKVQEEHTRVHRCAGAGRTDKQNSGSRAMVPLGRQFSALGVPGDKRKEHD